MAKPPPSTLAVALPSGWHRTHENNFWRPLRPGDPECDHCYFVGPLHGAGRYVGINVYVRDAETALFFDNPPRRIQ